MATVLAFCHVKGSEIATIVYFTPTLRLLLVGEKVKVHEAVLHKGKELQCHCSYALENECI